MTTNEMRAAFEKWVLQARKQTQPFGLVERSGDGYIDLYTQKHWEGWQAALATPSVASPQHIFDADSPSQDCSCGWKTTPEHRFTIEQAHKAWRRHKDSVEPAAPVGEPGRTLDGIDGQRWERIANDVIDGGTFRRHMIPESRRELKERIIDALVRANRAAPPAQGAPTPALVATRARLWVRQAEELGEKTDHVHGLSEYRIDAAEQAFKAGWDAALAAQGAPGTREHEIQGFACKNCGLVASLCKYHTRCLAALAQPGAPTKEGTCKEKLFS
jgi:hypothetical protein